MKTYFGPKSHQMRRTETRLASIDRELREESENRTPSLWNENFAVRHVAPGYLPKTCFLTPKTRFSIRKTRFGRPKHVFRRQKRVFGRQKRVFWHRKWIWGVQNTFLDTETHFWIAEKRISVQNRTRRGVQRRDLHESIGNRLGSPKIALSDPQAKIFEEIMTELSR